MKIHAPHVLQEEGREDREARGGFVYKNGENKKPNGRPEVSRTFFRFGSCRMRG
jgi:hypothetical protein